MEITVEKVTALLDTFCEHDGKIQPDTELLESGILDSMAFIELLNALEDMGCPIQPTRCPRGCFSTAESIAALCRGVLQNNDFM